MSASNLLRTSEFFLFLGITPGAYAVRSVHGYPKTLGSYDLEGPLQKLTSVAGKTRLCTIIDSYYTSVYYINYYIIKTYLTYFK